MKKVCYFTTKVSTDIRIFEKECSSLAKAGYFVYLISPNAITEVRNGVNITGVKFLHKSTFARLFILPYKLYQKAVSLNADIYHFNEPSALHFGLLLKLKKKKVIFDSFEDHPTLILEHKKLPLFVMKLISTLYEKYEYFICRYFDAIISCYHWTQERLERACSNNALIFNFPIIKAEQQKVVQKTDVDEKSICYAGLFSEMWNIENILTALSEVENVRFNLAGNGSEQIINQYKLNKGWSKVNYFGKLNYSEVFDKVFAKSAVGMALLDYIPLCKGNIGNMSNNKLFEYMAAGLPVICTDFVLWKEVVEGNSCGICVNSRDNSAIVSAINYLLNNPEIAYSMGKNGRKSVEVKYNWSNEEKKLLKIYSNLND